MPRTQLSEHEWRMGRALGAALGARRYELAMSAEHVAREVGLSVDTLRKIEQGRVANPGLFTVAAVATHLELRLDDLARSAQAAAAIEVTS